MELGETTAQGAIRETTEEAGARVELQGLYSLINVVRVGQVHLFYRARMLDADFVPGPESLEATLFAEADVPWDEIAFRTTKMTLEFFFADRREVCFTYPGADEVYGRGRVGRVGCVAGARCTGALCSTPQA